MNRKRILSLILSVILLSGAISYAPSAKYQRVGGYQIASENVNKPFVERVIPKGSMEAVATSHQTGEEGSKAIDGKNDTLWHTPWDGSGVLPQSLSLTFDREYEVSSIKVTPRQSGGDNGKIQKYEVYSGETKIAEGTWDTSSSVKIVKFDSPINTDNIEIKVLQGIGGYASVAEVDVYTMVSEGTLLSQYDNLIIDAGAGGNKTEDLSKYENLEEGTIIARFNHKKPGLQTIFSVSNNNTNNGHFHIYTFDGKVGYEIRYDDGTSSRNLATGVTNAVLNSGINTMALKVEKDIGYSIYLNGEKVLFTSSADTSFISDLFEANTVNLGKTDRKSGNEYLFNGNIDFVQVYADPLADEYLENKTSETTASKIPLPEGAMKTDPISVYTPGEFDSTNFRIPSMITTKDGSLLAAIDVRKRSGADSPNNIDTGVKRSTDGGETWDEGQIILDYPDSASGIDASMLQDNDSGKIFLLVDAFPHGKGAFQALRGSGFKDVIVDGETKRGMILKNSSNIEFYAVDITEDLTVDEEIKELAVVVDESGNLTEYRVDASNNLYRASEGSAVKIGNTFAASAELKAFGTSYLALITSEDDGVTWSEPKLISGEFKKEWMSFLGTGPGNGIQVKNGEHAGRLIFPVYYLNKNQKQSSATIYSDDGGATWSIGESVNDGRLLNGQTIHSSEITGARGEEMTECQVVEMPDGQLKMFMRNPSIGNPAVATSFDGGETWEPIVEYETDLREPYCQLSIINYSGKIDDKDALIFSNPDASTRSQGTVQIGLINEVGVDENGNKEYDFEWKYKQLIKPGYYAYSSLAELPNGDIGLFYEGTPNTDMSFTKMNVQYVKSDLLAEAPKATLQEISIIDEITDYRAGDEINIKLTFDQAVSLIGDRNLGINIGEEVLTLSMKEYLGANSVIFTGNIPESVKAGNYPMIVNGNSALEVVNTVGKLTDISDDIETQLNINVIEDGVEEEVVLEYKGGLLEGEGIDVTSDIDKLKAMDEGIIVSEFETASTGIQSIFSVSNNNKANGHFHVYIANEKIGYELRYEGPNGKTNLSTGTTNVTFEEGKNKLGFKAEKGVGYSMFLNGEKVLSVSKTDSNFLKDLFELNSAFVGKTDRLTGFEYPFTGEISYVNVNSKVLSDEEMMKLTSKEELPVIVDKVINLKVVEKNAESIKLNWQSPINSTGLSKYIIYKDGKETAQLEPDTTEYKVENLRENTIYGFKIVTEYSNGERSKPVSINVRTDKK